MAASTTRRSLFGLAAVYLAAVLAGVLVPQPVREALAIAGDGPFAMGWLADALRNILLFLPLGAMIFLRTGSIATSIALAGTLAIGIELLQMGIPGRFSSPLDVLSNALGAGLGAWLVLHWSAIRSPDRRLAPWITPIASVLAVLVLLAESALLAPDVPDTTYYGGWTPELGHLVRYGGRVTSAVLDGQPIPAAGPARNGAEIQRELRDGASLAIALRVGPRPEALAPVVTIHDGDQREILLVGIDGDDLVVRRLLRAAAFGLENPSRRWRDALRTSPDGALRSIDVRFDGADSRAAVAGGEASVRDWTPGRGWALFLPAVSVPDAVVPWLDGLWIAVLTFPAAYHAGRQILPLAALGGIAVALVGLPGLGSLGPPGLAEWLGFGISLALGMGMGGRFNRLSAER